MPRLPGVVGRHGQHRTAGLVTARPYKAARHAVRATAQVPPQGWQIWVVAAGTPARGWCALRGEGGRKGSYLRESQVIWVDGRPTRTRRSPSGSIDQSRNVCPRGVHSLARVRGLTWAGRLVGPARDALVPHVGVSWPCSRGAADGWKRWTGEVVHLDVVVLGHAFEVFEGLVVARR